MSASTHMSGIYRFSLCPLLLLLLAVAARGAATDEYCDWAGPRVDCGYVGIDEGECRARGCCWHVPNFEDFPHVDLPWCFTKNAFPSEYGAVSNDGVETPRDEAGPSSIIAALSKATQPELGPDVPRLRISAEDLGCGILHITIRDADRPRWEIPGHFFHPNSIAAGAKRDCSKRASATTSAHSGYGPTSSGQSSSSSLHWVLHESPFSIEVERDSATIFNTTGHRLVYKDQYLELSTTVNPEATLFGAGERVSRTLHLKRNGAPRPLWNRDIGPALEEQNSYGSHPWIIGLEPDGRAWGALLLSSNAMDIVPTPERVSWRVTGGILDLYIFGGPSPLEIMEQLTAVIGRPALVPYWTLGWHQCKYGYKDIWEVRGVVANYSAANIPLEAQWIDIDLMNKWMDFTFDPVRFPVDEMQKFVGELHENGQHFVSILDPGIKTVPGYPAYDHALAQDLFVKNVQGEPYLGWVWPGPCNFIDFFNPKADEYWLGELAEYHKTLDWDGIWIDMNEISNFCSGDLCKIKPEMPSMHSSNGPRRLANRFLDRSVYNLDKEPQWACHLECWEAQELNETQRNWQKPPYQISNSLARLPLGFRVMSVLNTHFDGTVEYNAHQLYSLSQNKATAAAVRRVRGQRPFVLSRSSFPGVGSYAAHWTGDNQATWSQLAKSIPGVLNIGLFGIAMAGADICGFQLNTTAELCARWISMGAFYPFARSHSDRHSSRQELFLWPEVADAGRAALEQRYRLLPYIYTTMRKAHDTGAPAMRPLWMNFPDVRQTHTNDRQFMFGDSLLVTPVLNEGARSVQGFFPPGRWYSLWNTSALVEAGSTGKTVVLDAPLDRIPYHVRGGSILGMAQPALTTRQVRDGPLTLLVAFDSDNDSTTQRAFGELYHDHDDDDSTEGARSSPCSFLQATAVERVLGTGEVQGGLQLRIGNPTGFHIETGGSTSWPRLSNIEVAGSKTTGSPAVFVQDAGTLPLADAQIPTEAVHRIGSSLSMDLSSLNIHLRCRTRLVITWTAEGQGSIAEQ